MPLPLNIDIPDLAQAQRFDAAAFRLGPGRRFGHGWRLIQFSTLGYGAIAT